MNHFKGLAWRFGTPIRWLVVSSLCLVALWWETRPAETTSAHTVTVAQENLAAGAIPESGQTTQVPSSLDLDTPAPNDLAGEKIRGPIAAGEPITRSSIVPGRMITVGNGSVVYPLPLTDEYVADILEPGDLVDVMVTTSNLDARSAEVVAARVPVLAIPPQEARLSLGRTLVLIEVTSQQAAALAAPIPSLWRVRS